uniref:hypothetical protein n=1 Tax=uncultured Thiodictyon sp. TaxID=1846217 RepID=UPI0025FEDDAC
TVPDAARSVPLARPASDNIAPPVRQGRGAPTLPDQRSTFMQACRKDTTSDGWGNVYGHIMWSDPMAEANVNP